MSYRKRVLFLGLTALGALLWSPAAQSEEGEASRGEPPICWSHDLRPWPDAAPTTLLGARPVDAQALGQQRGGAQTLSLMKLQGVVADNAASDLVTGHNVITEGAFSGAAGLPTVIQNSGNNVLIQNATIVNVQVQ